MLERRSVDGDGGEDGDGVLGKSVPLCCCCCYCSSGGRRGSHRVCIHGSMDMGGGGECSSDVVNVIVVMALPMFDDKWCVMSLFFARCGGRRADERRKILSGGK